MKLIQRAGRGWEAHPEVRERSGGPFATQDWLGVHPGDLGGVGMTTQMSGRLTWRSGLGQEVHLEGQERSGGAPAALGAVRKPIRRVMTDREAHPKVWEGSGGTPLEVHVGMAGPSGGP